MWSALKVPPGQENASDSQICSSRNLLVVLSSHLHRELSTKNAIAFQLRGRFQRKERDDEDYSDGD